MALAEALPPDASTASTGLSLRYIGDWAYASSGAFNSTTAEQEVLNFTTGSGFIVANFQFNGVVCNVNSSCVGGGAASAFTIKFNEIIVAKLKTETAQELWHTVKNELIIPPFTSVTVDIISTQNDSSFDSTVNMVGRVYDA